MAFAKQLFENLKPISHMTIRVRDLHISSCVDPIDPAQLIARKAE